MLGPTQFTLSPTIPRHGLAIQMFLGPFAVAGRSEATVAGRLKQVTSRKAAGLSDQKHSQTYSVCLCMCVYITVGSDIWLPMFLMTDMKATSGYYIKEATGVTFLLTLGKRMKIHTPLGNS